MWAQLHGGKFFSVVMTPIYVINHIPGIPTQLSMHGIRNDDSDYVEKQNFVAVFYPTVLLCSV